MSVAVYVMPLSTWLSGSFRTTWGGEGDLSVRRRFSPQDVRRHLESFGDHLERVLAFRPGWDESGPVRSAHVFSASGFAGPFLLARRWSYRLNFPRLSTLEPPQIWLPADFEPVVRLAAPWNPETEVGVASSVRIGGELDLLLREPLGELEQAEHYEDLQVAARLGDIARAAFEHRAPVILAD